VRDRKIEIGEALLRILNKYVENQRRPRRYGLEELLYPAEVHTIMLIGDHPGAGVTELASRAAITKGAVSQMLQKLDKKGLIRKSSDPVDGKRLVLELTSKGKVAYYSHKRLHEEMDKELFSFLHDLKTGQLEVLRRFLALIEKGVDRRKTET
jgi:DNA-binding MarR family transcriptional regulator